MTTSTQFLSGAGRIGQSALVSLTLLSALLPATPARAAPPLADPIAVAAPAFDDKLDPDARLQVIVKSIKILDDHDWGEGEMFFRLWFWQVKTGCPEDSRDDDCTTALLASAPMQFGADDGDVFTLNRNIPDPNVDAWVLNSSIGPESGIPVFADQAYGFALGGTEEDPIIDDDMGVFFRELNAANKWNIGTAEATPAHSLDANGCHLIPPGCGFAATVPGSFVGDFTVNYEIRSMPLPDLAIRTVQQIHGDNGEWFYCPQVTNYGQRPSGGFALESRAGQTILRNIAMPALEIGQTAGNCILRSEIPQGQTKLSFRIDGTRQIAEMDEHNNAYEWTIPTLPAAVLAPNEAPSDPANSAATQLAPTISAIRLNGKQPTGQSDCTIGKNDITVTVRNGEAVPTDATVLRLQVDKNTDDAEEKSVASLDKGKSVDVSFEDIRLKKGSHTLTASLDAESETTEPKKDGNELSVSVSCKDQSD